MYSNKRVSDSAIAERPCCRVGT